MKIHVTVCFLAMMAVLASASGSAANLGIPVNPEREAYYGDLHLITGNAFTGYPMSYHLKPVDAYHFARGEPVSADGKTFTRRSAPLDFLAVTDFGEYLGLFNTLDDPNSPFSRTDLGKRLRDPATRIATFGEFLQTAFFQRGEQASFFGVDRHVITHELASTWQQEIAAANESYRPGKFTTFIAYHWTAKVGGTQDRVIVFRGATAPLPFTSLDSPRLEDLWTYLENNRKRGVDNLAIAHNSNLSNGLMFSGLAGDGKPIDTAYAQRCAANEPVIEISNNGQSETLPQLSPEDPFSDFELFGNGKLPSPRGSYVRDGLGRGLEIAQRTGVNPYQLGFVGGTDFHNAMSDAAENASDSTPDVPDPRGALTEEALRDQSTDPHPYAAGSLTGVWAEQNTRDSIFAAIRRRETFATSGTRLKFRFFGGWNYRSAALKSTDWVKEAYRQGVPMGAILPAKSGASRAPTFIAWATKDPAGANLDRVQIVKIWLKKGKPVENVYDVAFSDARTVDPRTGKAPEVGNTVDLHRATYTNTIGASQLAAVWTDPDFDSQSAAAYYLRVLEIPTPRWSTIAAAKAGITIPQGVAKTIQERGWSSPVWYSPSAESRPHRGSNGG